MLGLLCGIATMIVKPQNNKGRNLEPETIAPILRLCRDLHLLALLLRDDLHLACSCSGAWGNGILGS